MDAPRGRIFLSTIALGLVMTAVGYVIAQRTDEKAPSDVKPAQAASPGAQPVDTTDRNRTDRRTRDRRTDGAVGRRSTERRAEDRDADRTTVRTRERQDNLNLQLAACLLHKNKGEVELGKIAADRASNQEVKDFAETMVKDHGQQMKKLQDVVGSNEPSDRRSKIERDIHERCLASMKKELNNKSGRVFDECYVTSQILGHMQMAAALEVVSEHATGDLRDIIKDAQPTIDKHLAHAKKLMEQLDQSHDHSQASKDRSETQR